MYSYEKLLLGYRYAAKGLISSKTGLYGHVTYGVEMTPAQNLSDQCQRGCTSRKGANTSLPRSDQQISLLVPARRLQRRHLLWMADPHNFLELTHVGLAIDPRKELLVPGIWKCVEPRCVRRFKVGAVVEPISDIAYIPTKWSAVPTGQFWGD